MSEANDYANSVAFQQGRDEALPTMRQEIDRKAFEECERLALGLKQGKISQAQFASSMLTLFNAVSGLCSKSIMDMISEIRHLHVGPAPKPNPYRILYRTGEGKLFMLHWRPGESTVRVAQTSQTVDPIITVIERATPGEARQVFEQLARKLALSKGAPLFS